MKFLVYSSQNSSSIETALGTADYSYYFVMRRFIPLLQEYGEVVVLEAPATDEVVAGYQDESDCIYLSFTPPDQLPDISLCPAVPVFAWEYSDIPYEQFTRPEDNWVYELEKAGRAITHSTYAAEVVRKQLGKDYDIASIPAPLWDSCEGIRQARADTLPLGLDGLDLNCTEIDSACYDISNTSVRPKAGLHGENGRFRIRSWEGEPLELSLAGDEPGVTLIGFNEPESWGVWSRSGYPWMMLDQTICGRIELEITVRGYAHNVGVPVRLELGTGCAYLMPGEHLETHVVTMQVDYPSNVLALFGVDKRAEDMDDPWDIGLGISQLRITRLEPPAEPQSPLELDFSSEELQLEGFHEVEPVGRWTASPHCIVKLPRTVSGKVKVKITLFHMFHNEGRTIDFWLGGQRHKITLAKGVYNYKLRMSGVTATDYALLGNLGLGPGENPEDPRLLGLGVAKMSLVHRAACKRKKNMWPHWRGFLDFLPRGEEKNILYTSIFNPNDGRKNWEDIVTAFVYAFRENEDVTLLIKITNNDLSMFFEDIFSFFIELHPFKCRLVIIHGYLHYEEYEQLLIHSHFIVNASRGEGQCLPLMEFMSSGVPAVAPDNTAMADYLDNSNAFVVASSPDLTFWPHDPRQVFRTHWQRINWQSLHDAFLHSEEVARSHPEEYRQMAGSAINSLERFCSMSNARERFRSFVERIGDRGAQ